MHRVAIGHKRRSQLESRARELRSRLTPSEAALWSAISGSQLGVHFRRQHNIGPFIVDFVAVRPRLVVEVDGACHSARRSADARRDRALARSGFRVLRISAELVLGDLESALQLIRAALLR
jgi:very-short-patch-repair endonuclease